MRDGSHHRPSYSDRYSTERRPRQRRIHDYMNEKKLLAVLAAAAAAAGCRRVAVWGWGGGRAKGRRGRDGVILCGRAPSSLSCLSMFFCGRGVGVGPLALALAGSCRDSFGCLGGCRQVSGRLTGHALAHSKVPDRGWAGARPQRGAAMMGGWVDGWTVGRLDGWMNGCLGWRRNAGGVGRPCLAQTPPTDRPKSYIQHARIHPVAEAVPGSSRSSSCCW